MPEPYVDDVMSRPVETVRPETLLREAAATLIEQDVGSVVVVDVKDRIEGLLTATDFVRVVRDGGPAHDATVAEFMRTDVVTTERSRPVGEVVEAMLDRLVHHVPVVENGAVVGMVTTFDLAARLGRTL